MSDRIEIYKTDTGNARILVNGIEYDMNSPSSSELKGKSWHKNEAQYTYLKRWKAEYTYVYKWKVKYVKYEAEYTYVQRCEMSYGKYEVNVLMYRDER